MLKGRELHGMAHAETQDDGGQDHETLLSLKALLPSKFVTTWSKGMRDVNLQADCWLGVRATGNAVAKLTFNCWGIEAELKSLVTELSRLKFLDSLYLDSNPLRGSLEDLRCLSRITTLSLSKCVGVVGSLLSLSHLKSLSALFLDETHVKGQLSDLAACRELLVLSLQNTHVAGSLDSCLQFPKVRSGCTLFIRIVSLQ